MLQKRKIKLLKLLSIITLLAACTDDKAPSQAAAIVNGEEISIYQVEDALHQSGLTGDEKNKQVMPQLSRLIEQALILQQAKADQLERDPDIITALEVAKRQILTEKWLQRKMSSVKKPTPNEIDEFYNTHPELFEKHKIFQLKELFIDTSVVSVEKIDQFIEATDDVNTLEHNLQKDKIPFATNLATTMAEQLPMDRLSVLSTVPFGRYIKVTGDKGILIQGVLSTKETPIPKEKASALIEVFLYNQARAKESNNLIKQLHESATVKYFGEFEKLSESQTKVNTDNQKDADKATTSN